MQMVVGARRLAELLRRVAGLNVDKSDLERLAELVGQKLNDLLIAGVRNASYNHRDLVMEPDLPLTKGMLQSLQEFRAYAEVIELEPILEHLATYPPLERELSEEVTNLLPDLVGMLILVAARLMKIIDPEVVNPGTAMWERTTAAMNLLV